MVKVSVIVPMYNSELFLEQCLTSVVNQTYKNLDIILINDGSTDSSLAICQQFAAKDDRIKVFTQTNAGVGSARKLGLAKVTGEYVSFVDSDDSISHEMIEKLVQAATQTKADIVECGFIDVDETGSMILKRELISQTSTEIVNNLKHILQQNNTTHFNVNKLFRYDLIKHIEYPTFHYSEDYYFNVMALLNCQKKTTISDALYYRTINRKSATQQAFSEKKLDVIKSGEAIADMIETAYPALTVWAIYYILENIIRLFYQLTVSRSENHDDVGRFLVTKFNHLYDQWKIELHKELDNKVHRSMLKLFRASPPLCMTFLKLYYVIRVNLFKKFGII